MATLACAVPLNWYGPPRSFGDVKGAAGFDYKTDKWISGCSFQNFDAEEHLEAGLPAHLGAGEGISEAPTGGT